MVYVTYTTEAIVCGSRANNTSDKAYLLFTREAGMIWAVARSVREQRSRQRYALQEFSHVKVSLVKGKSGWRIGSTQALTNYFIQAPSRIGRGGVAYVIKMLRRYVHGEHMLNNLFDDVVVACQEIVVAADIETVQQLQQLVELRTLHGLGYIAVPKNLQSLLTVTFVEAVATSDPAALSEIDRLIVQAAHVSHL